MRLLAFLRLPIAIVMLMAVFVVQGFATHYARPLGADAVAVLAFAIAVGLGLAVYLAYVRWIERRWPVAELALPGAGRELGSGLVLGAALFCVTLGVLAALGLYEAHGLRSPAVLVAPLAVSLGAGVLEELLFRGIVFRLVENALGTWIALLVSAALFGGVHLGNPNATWFAGLAIALEAGVMLAAAYVLTRRLWLPIGIHAAWNFTQGGIFSVAVSGGSTRGLVDGALAPTPSWLTGGQFGAEASVVAIIACTALGILLLAMAHRRGRLVAPRWKRH